MSLRAQLGKITANEELNFLLTNRIPRLALTRFMGRFSKIENPRGPRRVDRAMALVL